MGAEQFAIQLAQQAGKETASGIGGTIGDYARRGLDKFFGIDRDKEQLEQQEKLTDLQIKANKELANYTYDIQQKMYNERFAQNTPEKIKERLKEAGLNTALIYGGSGAVGANATSGNVSAGSANGSNASDASSRLQAETAREEIALQRQMLESQIKINEKQAEKTEAETDKIKGADTKNLNAKTAEIYENIKKIQSDTTVNKHQIELIDLQSNSLKIANDYNEKNNKELLIQNEAITRSILTDAEVKEESKKIVLNQYKADLTKTIIEIAEKKAGIKLTETKIQEILNNIKIANGRLELDKEKLNQDWKIALNTNSSGYMTKDLKGITSFIANSINNIAGKKIIDEEEIRK